MAGSEYRFSLLGDSVSGVTKVIQTLESRECALKAGELAKLLGVTRQHIYKIAASGSLPCFRIGAAVRFDPKQVAEWLKARMPLPFPPARAHKLAV
jgi:excisionase family DNA binding protein